MAELIKQWEDGARLTATYEGSGDGDAVFTSDANEGIDREMSVSFVDASGSVVVERTVSQVGLRQPYGLKGGGVFRVKGGGRYGVLKTSVELPYAEELEYLESRGKQWIETGCKFDYTKDTIISAEAMALSTGRGVIIGNYYNNSNAVMAIEFGGTANSHPGAGRGYVLIKAASALDMWSSNLDINVKRSISLSFTASTRKAVLNFDGEIVEGVATDGKLNVRDSWRLFLDARSNTSPISSSMRIYSAQIKQGGELVRDFIPVIDKEGVACMYDKVSKEFFYNKGTGVFIAGNIK